jgi:hypothetical protein
MSARWKSARVAYRVAQLAHNRERLGGRGTRRRDITVGLRDLAEEAEGPGATDSVA